MKHKGLDLHSGSVTSGMSNDVQIYQLTPSERQPEKVNGPTRRKIKSLTPVRFNPTTTVALPTELQMLRNGS